jgi:tRNA U34 5-carboxymethylaminomethyl modifying GTPase MnmE/TrmE
MTAPFLSICVSDACWMKPEVTSKARPDSFIRGHDAELAAIEIKDALGNLQEVLGQGLAPDVLDHVFERFCIGK